MRRQYSTRHRHGNKSISSKKRSIKPSLEIAEKSGISLKAIIMLMLLFLAGKAAAANARNNTFNYLPEVMEPQFMQDIADILPYQDRQETSLEECDVLLKKRLVALFAYDADIPKEKKAKVRNDCTAIIQSVAAHITEQDPYLMKYFLPIMSQAVNIVCTATKDPVPDEWYTIISHPNEAPTLLLNLDIPFSPAKFNHEASHLYYLFSSRTSKKCQHDATNEFTPAYPSDLTTITTYNKAFDLGDARIYAFHLLLKKALTSSAFILDSNNFPIKNKHASTEALASITKSEYALLKTYLQGCKNYQKSSHAYEHTLSLDSYNDFINRGWEPGKTHLMRLKKDPDSPFMYEGLINGRQFIQRANNGVAAVLLGLDSTKNMLSHEKYANASPGLFLAERLAYTVQHLPFDAMATFYPEVIALEAEYKENCGAELEEQIHPCFRP